MTALLHVDRLSVEISSRGRAVRAIDGVSLSIEAGEILGVVGESGAGKSVTGTAILGLLEPPARQSEGSITLAGRRIDGLDEAALRELRGRHIGAVFQDPLTCLNPLLTIGHQLVQTITTHLPLSREQARARSIALLTEVGIAAPEQRLASYPHQLSGGMRQRIVLALAFACEPELIIADEPTTALDVSVQAQVIALLRRMCRERGTAVMLITHDMGVIAEAADRIAVMYAGRVVEVGATARLLRAPLHPYSRGLMASIPGMRRQPGMLPQIAGAMPRPGALPGGCSFHPRCPIRIARCAVEAPALRPLSDGAAACWLAEDRDAAAIA